MSDNASIKHKVFISYYHYEDQNYKDEFEELFGDTFINKSVQNGDIDSDNSDEYIKRLIQEGYISDTSVIVVLVGSNTWKRKHVDWEISAALSKKVGGYSGVVGICLPTHPAHKKHTYNASDLPPRLADNLKSEFAEFYDWTTSESKIKSYIETAFEAKSKKCDLINNNRIQYKDNKS